MTPQITVIFCDDYYGDEPPCDPSIYGAVTVSAEDPEIAANVIRSALRDTDAKTYPHKDLAVFDCMRGIIRRRGYTECDVHLDPLGRAHTIDSYETWIVWLDGDDMLIHCIGAEQIKLKNLMCRFDSDAELVMADTLGKIELDDEERASQYEVLCNYIP